MGKTASTLDKEVFLWCVWNLAFRMKCVPVKKEQKNFYVCVLWVTYFISLSFFSQLLLITILIHEDKWENVQDLIQSRWMQSHRLPLSHKGCCHVHAVCALLTQHTASPFYPSLCSHLPVLINRHHYGWVTVLFVITFLKLITCTVLLCVNLTASLYNVAFHIWMSKVWMLKNCWFFLGLVFYLRLFSFSLNILKFVYLQGGCPYFGPQKWGHWGRMAAWSKWTHKKWMANAESQRGIPDIFCDFKNATSGAFFRSQKEDMSRGKFLTD